MCSPIFTLIHIHGYRKVSVYPFILTYNPPQTFEGFVILHEQAPGVACGSLSKSLACEHAMAPGTNQYPTEEVYTRVSVQH